MRVSRVLSLLVIALISFASLGLIIYASPTANSQKMWSAFWTVAPGYTSILEMKNNRAARVLTVQPTLYFRSGEELPLAQIVLGPRQTGILSLNDTLRADLEKHPTHDEGTLEVEVSDPDDQALMGNVSVTSPQHGIAWNFRLYGLAPAPTPSPVRGVFWFHDEHTEGFVAAQNTSDDFINVRPAFDVAGRTYQLSTTRVGPDQGFKIDLRRELRGLGLKDIDQGGIQLAYEGQGGALIAHEVLFNNTGFSTEVDLLPQADAGMGQSVTLRTPQFAIGPADTRLGLQDKVVFQPTLALHNFAPVAITTNVAVGYQVNSQPAEKQLSFSLAPGETQVNSLYSLLKDVIPSTVPWLSLEVQYAGAHNDVAAALVSVSQDGKHSIRSVLNWVEGSASDGPFWLSDESQNSLIGMFNTDTEPALVNFSLDYYVGATRHSHALDTIKIPPRSTYQVDVGAVIAAGKPDASGDTIPATVTFGGYRVEKTGPRLDHILTTEELLFDRQSKSFLTFYNTCCSYLSTSFAPSSLLGSPGDNGQMTTQALSSCSNAWVDVTSSTIYGTQNSSIATAASGGHAHLVAIGQTNLTAQFNYFKKPCFFGCTCNAAQSNGTTPTTVVPKITSLSPSRGLINATTKSVTITGTGLLGGHINTPAAIQVANITTATDDTMVFDLVISSTATAGNNAGAIYVTASQQTSNKEDFYVQVPTSLSIVSGSATGTTEQMCTSNACGTIVRFTYQVNDQDTSSPQPIRAAMSMYDTFASTYSPDDLQMQGSILSTTCPNNSGPCNVSTNTNGTFTEFALGACSTVCFAGSCQTGKGSSGIDQTWHIAGQSIVQHVAQFCEKVTINGTQVQ